MPRGIIVVKAELLDQVPAAVQKNLNPNFYPSHHASTSLNRLPMSKVRAGVFSPCNSGSHQSSWLLQGTLVSSLCCSGKGPANLYGSSFSRTASGDHCFTRLSTYRLLNSAPIIIDLGNTQDCRRLAGADEKLVLELE